jgi:glycosyltransferase involved in cell wall biosynthesis
MVRHPPDLLFVPAHVLPPVRPRYTLVTVHDLGYLTFPKAHPPAQRRYLDLTTRWNARVATHVLADSQATRADLVRAYAVDPEKVSVVYPGYDRTLQPVTDPQALARVRQRYGIPGDYVLFLGRIQPRKNLKRLIRAFKPVAEAYPALTLVLAGPTGWLADPIREAVETLGLEDRVRFTGYVDAADKAALLSGARLFAYPSLYEGFGFPVLEAQACHTPVLVSDNASLPEVGGDAALYVCALDADDIAQGLLRLLADAELRRALVARGEANLHRFSWQKAARQVQDVIETLLHEEPSP